MFGIHDAKRVSHTTDEVYGVTREIPLNYVTRDTVDNSFVANLTRDKHVVIFGSSKQGKTCLRKHCLKEDDYILVQCSNKWNVQELNSNILKRAGFQVVLSDKKTVEGGNKIKAGLKLGVGAFGAELGGEQNAKTTNEIEVRDLELDPGDVNDIIAALDSASFTKFIVLEDFHYLPVPTQIDFAVALKAFHEASTLCFIVIGVWLDNDRLIVYNGDLTGRVVSVDADTWTEKELRAVVGDGAALLNVSFDERFLTELVALCKSSVYVVQEACRLACLQAMVTCTKDTTVEVGKDCDVKELIRTIVDQQSGRYTTFINLFSGGYQDTQLQMYRWLLHPILTASSEKLQSGFKYAELRKHLQQHHPSGKNLNAGNLTQALQYCASLQVDKNIKPIVLDYDQTGLRLNIVDRGFIMWLEHQDRAGLLEAIDLPHDAAAPTLPGLQSE